VPVDITYKNDDLLVYLSDPIFDVRVPAVLERHAAFRYEAVICEVKYELGALGVLDVDHLLVWIAPVLLGLEPYGFCMFFRQQALEFIKLRVLFDCLFLLEYHQVIPEIIGILNWFLLQQIDVY